jgi:hypothetical protein
MNFNYFANEFSKPLKDRKGKDFFVARFLLFPTSSRPAPKKGVERTLEKLVFEMLNVVFESKNCPLL